MKKPRILIVIPDKLNKPTGGLGVQCEYLIKHLKHKYDFDLVGYPDPDAKDDPNYTGVYNPLPKIGHASLVTIACQSEYFKEAVKRPKPDIVHGYDWSTLFASVQTADVFDVPMVATMQLSINLLNQVGIHYVDSIENVEGFWINEVHREMEMYGMRESDKIIHVSDAYANKFNAIEDMSEKSITIPNGIEMSDWESFEKVELPGTRRYKIVYIGRIAMMKNILSLIHAKVPEDIDLIFVGSNTGGEADLFNAMREFADRNDNVHYYGPAYGQDKVNVLSSADAVIIPSVHEPFGIVALEALAAKAILLSSFVDGMSDFLTEDVAIKCGISSQSIEMAYHEFLRLTEEEKKERVEKGLDICHKYSWEKAIKMVDDVYQDILKNKDK